MSMQLGAFSISLAVRDLNASRTFYEKLGFAVVAGDASQNWLVLRSQDKVTLGLFHGMFDRNTLTFNPGWDRDANDLARFTDVRVLQEEIEAHGLTPTTRADASTSGPASLMLIDPDGNPILIDQHR
jgi:catechol 2,3-dioxygenase-like lactoylglutathione lyase family enzyme